MLWLKLTAMPSTETAIFAPKAAEEKQQSNNTVSIKTTVFKYLFIIFAPPLIKSQAYFNNKIYLLKFYHKYPVFSNSAKILINTAFAIKFLRLILILNLPPIICILILCITKKTTSDNKKLSEVVSLFSANCFAH